MKKKIICALALVGTMFLTGCATSNTTGDETTPTNSGAEKYSIVATSFHEYDWVMQVLGDEKENFDVTLLMDTGVDMHSYEPSVEDIATINSSDLFIYNGGNSQSWVTDAIANPSNSNFKSINVMESLGDEIKEEEIVEGMQNDSNDHDHDHEEETEADDHDHDHEEATDADDHDDHDHDEETSGHDDEHVWLSLDNAKDVCEVIGDEIAKIDTENASTYRTNADNYIKTLDDLDNNYETAIKSAPRDTLIFADRFPFLYMLDEYDVNYYAAFQGCSAETEASFETITFLAGKVDELDVNKLLIIDNGLEELAQTINNSSQDKDCKILTLNSLQSVSSDDINSGATYYKYMSENLEVLIQALAQ